MWKLWDASIYCIKSLRHPKCTTIYLTKLFQLIDSHSSGFKSVEGESDFCTYTFLDMNSLLLYIYIHCPHNTFFRCNLYNSPILFVAGGRSNNQVSEVRWAMGEEQATGAQESRLSSVFLLWTNLISQLKVFNYNTVLVKVGNQYNRLSNGGQATSAQQSRLSCISVSAVFLL